VIRWGGEEFLLIANGLREEDVDLFANKLLAEVEKNLFICKEKAENIQVTISMGISYFNKTDLTPEEGLERADAALYQAKAEGKNRACKA
jgi:diguanylate cyclase (GGDEF)-like protein